MPREVVISTVITNLFSLFLCYQSNIGFTMPDATGTACCTSSSYLSVQPHTKDKCNAQVMAGVKSKKSSFHPRQT